jgi:hypothetical protein
MMHDEGHTIIFKYTPTDHLSLVSLGLFFLFVPFVIFVCSLFMKIPWHIYLISLPFFITSIYLLVFAWIIKRNFRKGVYISVSPKGVINPRGKFFPIEDIDNCYVHFEVAKETGQIYKAYFNILLKSGKKKRYKFNNYIVPFDWDMNTFPHKVNAILGISLFTDSVIEIREIFDHKTD